MAKDTAEEKMRKLNTEAHNRMAGVPDDIETDEEFYMENGYRRSKEHEKQAVDKIAEDLISVARRIYDYRIAVAMGEMPKEALNRGMVEYQQYIIDIVEPMIKTYQQTQNLDANTSAEVIALLGKGKVTPKEALELLKVIGKTIEVEAAELRSKLQKELMKED